MSTTASSSVYTVERSERNLVHSEQHDPCLRHPQLIVRADRSAGARA